MFAIKNKLEINVRFSGVIYLYPFLLGIKATLEKGGNCPNCSQENVSVDQLIPNKTLVKAIDVYLEEQEELKKNQPEPMEQEETPEEEEVGVFLFFFLTEKKKKILTKKKKRTNLEQQFKYLSLQMKDPIGNIILWKIIT